MAEAKVPVVAEAHEVDTFRKNPYHDRKQLLVV